MKKKETEELTIDVIESNHFLLMFCEEVLG